MSKIMSKPATSVSDRIMQRVRRSGRGSVFASSDFLDLGSRSAVDAALSRLAKGDRLRRLAPGLFDYPRTSDLLGLLSPSADAVAKALAREGGGKLQLDGAATANALGVSTQVPARPVYLTDGPPRKVKIGRQIVTLKHVSPRYLPAPGKPAGAVFQAVRWLGRDGVTTDTVDRLRKALGPRDRDDLRKIATTAPSWTRPVLQRIATCHGS